MKIKMKFEFLSLLICISFFFSFNGILFVNNIAYSSIDNNTTLSEKNRTPIEHIIIISQGRRSFDNYFGTFPGANGFPENLTVPINPFKFIPSFQYH